MFSQWKSLKNYIHVFKNVVPRVLCDEIVNYYKHSVEWENAKVQGSFADKNSYVKETTRSCSELLLTNSMFQKPLYNIVGNCLGNYIEQHLDVQDYVSSSEEYRLLKYDCNNFYKRHIDSHANTPRTISLTLSLNDNYKGGEFSFFDDDYKLNLEKGSALMFPSNFMYPHGVLPVKMGTRYSIVTWFN